ncbi:hypothetical protein HK096_000619 [Nowakowskiella sp. JEL0078]|nr:hypothetical protein HK096_000619 [Nowakowskiella sp. JEL0078]
MESVSYMKYTEALEKISELSGVIINLHKSLDQAKEEIERLKQSTRDGNENPKVFWVHDNSPPPVASQSVVDAGEIDNLFHVDFHQNNDNTVDQENSKHRELLLPWLELLQKYFPEHVESVDMFLFENSVQIFLDEKFGKDRDQKFHIPLTELSEENSGTFENEGNRSTLQNSIPVKLSQEFFNWCKERKHIFGLEKNDGTQLESKESIGSLNKDSPKPLRKRGRPSKMSKMLEAASAVEIQQTSENRKYPASSSSPADDLNDSEFNDQRSKKISGSDESGVKSKVQYRKSERFSYSAEEVSNPSGRRRSNRLENEINQKAKGSTGLAGKRPKRAASIFAENSIYAVSKFESLLFYFN